MQLGGGALNAVYELRNAMKKIIKRKKLLKADYTHLSTVIAFSHCRAHACKSPEMARFWEVSQRVFHKLLGDFWDIQHLEVSRNG